MGTLPGGDAVRASGLADALVGRLWHRRAACRDLAHGRSAGRCAACLRAGGTGRAQAAADRRRHVGLSGRVGRGSRTDAGGPVAAMRRRRDRAVRLDGPAAGCGFARHRGARRLAGRVGGRRGLPVADPAEHSGRHPAQAAHEPAPRRTGGRLDSRDGRAGGTRPIGRAAPGALGGGGRARRAGRPGGLALLAARCGCNCCASTARSPRRCWRCSRRAGSSST